MLHVRGLTDIGLVRRDNQDSYGTEKIGKFTVCVVCDGMGGYSGGRIASHMAVERFLQSCCERLTDGMSVSAVEQTITEIISQVNQTLFCHAQTHAELRQMGTTLVSAVMRNQEVVIHNVGDSRCYRITESGEALCLTRDHSLVQDLIEAGKITPEAARTHPERNVITRALGPTEVVESDSYRCELTAGECLFLCTDGLTGVLTDEQIAATLCKGADPCRALEQLREQVYAGGAGDNLTAVLVTQQ